MTKRFLEIVKQMELERAKEREAAEICPKCGEINHTDWVCNPAGERSYCKTPNCGATLYLPRE